MKLVSPRIELLGRFGQPLSPAATIAMIMRDAPRLEFVAVTLMATSASALPFEAQMVWAPGARLEGSVTVATNVPWGVTVAEPTGIGTCEVWAEFLGGRFQGALLPPFVALTATAAAEL